VYKNHEPKNFREKLVFSVAIHLFLEWLPGLLNLDGDTVMKYHGNPGQPVVHFFRHWEGDRAYNFRPKTTPPGAGLIHNMSKAVKEPLIAANEELLASDEEAELNEIGCGIRRCDIGDYEEYYGNDITKGVPEFYRFSWFLEKLFSNQINVRLLLKFKHHVDVERYPDTKSDSSDSDTEEEFEDPEELMLNLGNESDDEETENALDSQSNAPGDNVLSRVASNTSSTSKPSKKGASKAEKDPGAKSSKKQLTDREKLQRLVDKALAIEKRKRRWIGSVINTFTNTKSKSKKPDFVHQQDVIGILPFLFEVGAMKKISFDKEMVADLFMKEEGAMKDLATAFNERYHYATVTNLGHDAQGSINRLNRHDPVYRNEQSEDDEEDEDESSPDKNEKAASASPLRKKRKTDEAKAVPEAKEGEVSEPPKEKPPQNQVAPKTPESRNNKNGDQDGVAPVDSDPEIEDEKDDHKKKKGSSKKKKNKKKQPEPLIGSPFGKMSRRKVTPLYFPNETLTKEFKDGLKQRKITKYKAEHKSNLREPIRYEFENEDDLEVFNEIWAKSSAATGDVVIGLLPPKKEKGDNDT